MRTRTYALVAAAAVVYGVCGIAALKAQEVPPFLEDKCAHRFELYGHTLTNTNVFSGTHYRTDVLEYSVMGTVDQDGFGLCIFNERYEIVAATRRQGEDNFFLTEDRELKYNGE